MMKEIILGTMKNLNNFSVLVENSGANQLSFCVIAELNKLTQIRPEIDAILFYENQHKNCIPANFSTMQMSEAWGQTGPIIATSFSTANKLTSFPSEKKFFYVWDLDWIRNSYRYESLSKVYTDASLNLIARSESHKKAIENAFNRKVSYVVSDFNINEILSILEEN